MAFPGSNRARRAWGLVLVFFLVVACRPCMSKAVDADVIYFNGKIVTLDAAKSTADGVAIKDGKFLKVGTSEEVRRMAGPSTRLVDLQGRTVVPGLIDAHCHPMETLYLKDVWVDGRYPGTPSVKQALANLAARVKTTPKGAWIYVACVSASENKFVEKRIPTKAELDAVAPENPVLLANGAHLCVVNSRAIATLGIKKGTRRLAHGGTVVLDKNDEPTGVLADSMSDVPTNPTVAELESYYRSGIQGFWNPYGFTSVLAITPAPAVPVIQALAGSGKYKPTIRYTTSVWTSANGKDMPEDLSRFAMPRGTDAAWYRFGGIKDWVDGENDCRTGYMYQPYLGTYDTDPPGGKGTLVTDQEGANRFASVAHKSGAMSMLHCSGDAAVDIGLNAYDQVVRAGGAPTIMRIEHYGMFQLTDDQLKRAAVLKKKGLFVSVQPMWLLELVKADYENMGEERAKTGFRFRSMIDAGLEPAAGSDMTGIYLGNIDPWKAMYAAVTRNSDRGVFMPGEAVTVTEALEMWTTWAARSMGQADVKGSIEPGKYADMVVLSHDILTMPAEGLKDVKVLQTIVGGDVVYQAK